jgi:predicted O-methyltransferase YrrM
MNRYSQLVRAHIGIEKLKRTADSRLDHSSELVPLVFTFAGAFLEPLQIEAELAELVTEVRRLNPANVLEIGTARGGTLFLWTRLAQPDAIVVSIDLRGGKFGGGYSRWRGHVYRRFRRKHQRLHLLREDSHEPRTFNKTRELFRGRQIDLLFIDGDHTYEGVKKDWEMYSGLVRPGGLIVFHDIAGNYDDTQVKTLWDSIRSGFEHREYIFGQNGQYGIGILRK